MKGIILAGGTGSRLFPVTKAVNKHLLPVYNKPMIYYPLSTLMLAGIREILMISGERDIPMYRQLLGDGRHIGLRIQYTTQDRPGGIAEALIIGESFIGNDPVCLILGDNVFYANELHIIMKEAAQLTDGAMIFGYPVKDPERYGVVEFDADDRAVGLHEKPRDPPSHYAVPGLYFYDRQCAAIAKSLTPSARGELEITDVNKAYLAQGRLKVQKLGRGVAWLDTGTPDALLEASNFIQAIEHRQGFQIACLEEIAWRMGFIGSAEFKALADDQARRYQSSYLRSILASP